MALNTFWDQRYSEEEWVYGQNPNELFEKSLSDLPPGRILLPAEGEGRNAIFAARKGWDVTAFDFSTAAQTKALWWAKNEGLSLHYSIEDIPLWTPESNVFDVVGLIFVHLPAQVRVDFHRKVQDSLIAEGILILEAFRPEQLGNPSGGPQVLDLLYTPEEVIQDFNGMEVISSERWSGTLHEGKYHEGQAETWRLVMKKI